jgi:hypothetical protein
LNFIASTSAWLPDSAGDLSQEPNPPILPKITQIAHPNKPDPLRKRNLDCAIKGREGAQLSFKESIPMVIPNFGAGVGENFAMTIQNSKFKI